MLGLQRTKPRKYPHHRRPSVALKRVDRALAKAEVASQELKISLTAAQYMTLVQAALKDEFEPTCSLKFMRQHGSYLHQARDNLRRINQR